MKISEIKIENFKRFTSLKIQNIKETTKLVIIVGPNGSGKSSLFDALLVWYRGYITPYSGRDELYYPKLGGKEFDYEKNVHVTFHDIEKITKDIIKGKFYFRTAYRNEADFTISSLAKMDDPKETIRLRNLIQNDGTVQENYKRLVSLTLQGVFSETNQNQKVSELKEQLIGKIRTSLNNIFSDLNLSSIGDPLINGSFYFEKGTSKDFHYKNLSGGEKAAFDIILDLIIQSVYNQAAIYCIDEPETHMHTKLQSNLLEEIYNLLPSQSQLWINTHSIGLLKKAKEIETRFPNTVAFIDFENLDFDQEVILEPVSVDKAIWEKFMELTLGDYSKLIAPSKVVLCEGNNAGRRYKDFDKQVYEKIFQSLYTDVTFFSVGNSIAVENDNHQVLQAVKEVLRNPEIIRVTDKDDKSGEEIKEALKKGVKVLSLRAIESYLLDDEIIEKLCIVNDQSEKISDALAVKQTAITKSTARRNPSDDIKSASGDIHVGLKKLLNLNGAGNTKDAFLRDTMCRLITPDTKVYAMLEKDIFG